MSVSNLPLIHIVVEYFSEVVSLTVNTILFYYIMTETQKEMKNYRNILIVNCLADYFCLVVQILNQPRLEVVGDYYLNVISGIAIYAPKSWQIFFICLYTMELSLNINVLVLQYFYRYMFICRRHHLTANELIKCVILCIIVGVNFMPIYGIPFTFTDYQHFNYMQLTANPHIYGNDKPNAQSVIIAKINTWPVQLMLASILSFSIFFGSIILLLSWLTYRSLKAAEEHMSANTRRLQRQINFMLFVQTLFSFVIILLPEIIFSSVLFLGYRPYGFGTTIVTCLAFNQCVNPLCTLILVKHYRQRFLQSIFGKFGKRLFSNKVSTTPNPNETTANNLSAVEPSKVVENQEGTVL